MERPSLPGRAAVATAAAMAAPAFVMVVATWIAGPLPATWILGTAVATFGIGGYIAYRWTGQIARMRGEREGLVQAAEALTSLRDALAGAEAIVSALPDPIILIDANRVVVDANRPARHLFGEGIVAHDLATSIRHPQVLDAVDQVLERGGAAAIDYQVAVPVEQVYEVMVRTVGPVPSGARGAAVAVMVLHDMTAVRRAERMRGDFVANASHELRTPLATLIGFIETLRGPAREDDAARDRFLGIMAEQAGRMSRLVNDLLSLSRIELDEHTRATGSVDLVRTVRNVVDALEMKAKGRRKTVLVAVDGTPPMIEGDVDQIAQVVQNLVDNAINYSRTGTEVRVAIRSAPSPAGRGEGAELAVVDRGDGIPKEHVPRLTERFYRVDPARSRAIGGTGLGLAIVKHIVARHRGRLTIDSEEGVGSTFTVWLPAAPMGAPSAMEQNAAVPATAPVIKR